MDTNIFLDVFLDRPRLAEKNARSLPMNDFEDALQAAAAQAARVDWIITRNLKDFKSSPVPVLSPEQFVRRFV